MLNRASESSSTEEMSEMKLLKEVIKPRNQNDCESLLIHKLKDPINLIEETPMKSSLFNLAK
jgi:NifU-like protein involved in Fe-S cluster formation